MTDGPKHPDRTVEVLKAIEGLRQQQDVHHEKMEAEHRYMRETMIWLKQQWERFSK